MYKQTLCVTLPISAAVIIAAALFANAGDLNPPEGPIEPTMHTLDEIYELAAASQPCPPCTWESWSGPVIQGGNTQGVPGAGLLHGVWLVPPSSTGFTRVVLWDGDPDNGGVQIAIAHITMQEGALGNQFVQLDVAFENGLFLAPSGAGTPLVTILYRSNNP